MELAGIPPGVPFHACHALKISKWNYDGTMGPTNGISYTGWEGSKRNKDVTRL